MKKGGTNNKKGRPPGKPNKATTEAREAIAKFVDGNAHRMGRWLDQIAAQNPKAAFDCFMSVVEYHIPKLSRVDQKIGMDEDLPDQIAEIFRQIDGSTADLPKK